MRTNVVTCTRGLEERDSFVIFHEWAHEPSGVCKTTGYHSQQNVEENVDFQSPASNAPTWGPAPCFSAGHSASTTYTTTLLHTRDCD
jgi:hypothetical protein